MSRPGGAPFTQPFGGVPGMGVKTFSAKLANTPAPPSADSRQQTPSPTSPAGIAPAPAASPQSEAHGTTSQKPGSPYGSASAQQTTPQPNSPICERPLPSTLNGNMASHSAAVSSPVPVGSTPPPSIFTPGSNAATPATPAPPSVSTMPPQTPTTPSFSPSSVPPSSIFVPGSVPVGSPSPAIFTPTSTPTTGDRATTAPPPSMDEIRRQKQQQQTPVSSVAPPYSHTSPYASSSVSPAPAPAVPPASAPLIPGEQTVQTPQTPLPPTQADVARQQQELQQQQAQQRTVQSAQQQFHRPAPATSAPPGQRIDPNAMPSPVTSASSSGVITYHTRINSLPPSSTSQYRVVDDGNASPRFFRSSLYNLPVSSDLLKSSNLPFGAVLHPLAEPAPGEQPVPLVDLRPYGPLRCRRCKGYLCPFDKFINGGRHYSCSICGQKNDVPEEYFSPLQPNGLRHDVAVRPELSRGTVDFVAPKEYSLRPCLSMRWLFVLDVSAGAVQAGVVRAFVHAVKVTLKALPENCPYKFGFITYDRTIHFYNLNAALQKPQMLVVPDTEDVFPPISIEDNILVNYRESQSVIDTFLDQLSTMFDGQRVSHSCGGSAAAAAYVTLKDTGGKAIMMQSSLPSVGRGLLKPQLDSKVIGTDDERKLYQPKNNFYGELGESCGKAQVGIDMFLFGTAHLEVATLSELCCPTGGQIYHFPNFTGTEVTRFAGELYRNITRQTAYECVMKVRAGDGLNVKSHEGNFRLVYNTDMEFAVLDADKSVTVTFDHMENLNEKEETVIQFALLYTTSYGERRIRVCTISLHSSSVLSHIYKGGDVDVITNLLVRQVSAETFKRNFTEVRRSLVDRCTKILFAYRKFCSSAQNTTGQLILPESLKLLPVYVLATLKNPMLRSGSSISVDRRMILRHMLKSQPLHAFMSYIHPRLIALHMLNEKSGLKDEQGTVQLPPSVRLMKKSIEKNGAYIADNGVHIIVWVGSNLSPDFFEQVFGVASFTALDSGRAAFQPGTANNLAQQVRGIIQELQRRSVSHPSVVIVKEGELMEGQLANMLIEEKIGDAPTYVDFLCHIHKQIQNMMK